MASNFKIAGKKWKGYSDDPELRDPEMLASPSVNVVIDKTGLASTRPGGEDTGLNLSQSGKPARPYYNEQFDLTFFAVGTKVYYVEGELNSSSTKYDTGITLTNGTVSRFEEHNGVVYVTNSTDGAYGFLITRLNGAVSMGASEITSDVEGGAMANVFDTELSVSTKYLRINGTNEQYSAVSTSTGVFTLSGTASQDYDDDTIALVVYTLTGRFPKCDKIVAWKECLHFIGITPNSGNVTTDRRSTTLAFTQFATAAVSENILKVSGGTSGTELVGKSGKLVNAVATRDYLYLFKENAVYYIAVSDVNTTSGARPPQLLSENYGCLNADSAVDMGNGEVIFFTTNNRAIRIKIATESGAPVVFPDESFDQGYSNTFPLMDETQTDAFIFYAASEKRAYCQASFDTEFLTLPFNNEIRNWEPPRKAWAFGGFFERMGQLYATDRTDDTVYKLNSTLDDDGLAIECVIASPILEFEDGRVTCKWDQVEASGKMNEIATAFFEIIVNKGTPQRKTFDSTGVSFDTAPSLGSVTHGTTTLGGGSIGSGLGEWDKRYAIHPSLGSDLQLILSCSGEGERIAWKSYSVMGKALPTSSITLT